MNIWVDANGWPIPPLVLLGCLAAEILYFRGWRVLVKAEQRKTARAMTSPELTGSGGYRWDSVLWRCSYFLGSIFIILRGDSALIDIPSARFFWVHMIQHLLLLVVMAPLLVAAALLQPLWLGLPGWARRPVKVAARLKAQCVLYRVGHWLRQPAISCGLLIIGIWVWHYPALYDLALTNEAIHDWCEHLTFLAVSVLFWTQVIPSPPLRPRAGYLGQIVCIAVAIAQNVVLAILLGFAQAPLYPPHVPLTPPSSGIFSPLQYQPIGSRIICTF